MFLFCDYVKWIGASWFMTCEIYYSCGSIERVFTVAYSKDIAKYTACECPLCNNALYVTLSSIRNAGRCRGLILCRGQTLRTFLWSNNDVCAKLVNNVLKGDKQKKICHQFEITGWHECFLQSFHCKAFSLVLLRSLLKWICLTDVRLGNGWVSLWWNAGGVAIATKNSKQKYKYL